MSVILDYFQALERLKSGKATIVDKNTRITKNAVALEAGRKVGSIKKSRPIFAKLIEAIHEAAAEQVKPTTSSRERLNKEKVRSAKYRELYEQALAREVMLVKRIYELEAQLVKYTKNNVANIKHISE